MLVIKDCNGSKRAEIDINEGSIYKYELMKEEYIQLKFVLATPIAFEIGDYVDFQELLTDDKGKVVKGEDGHEIKRYEEEYPLLVTKLKLGRFILVSDYVPSYNTAYDGYEYTLKLDAHYYIFKNKIFKLNNNMMGIESSWASTSVARDFLNLIIANMNSYGDGKITYSLGGISGIDQEKRLTLSFSSTDIVSALNMIAEKCDPDNKSVEWWIDNYKLYLGKNEQTESGGRELEMGVNVESMTPSDGKRDKVTKVFAFGSDKNITNRYRKHVEYVIDKYYNDASDQNDDTCRIVATSGYVPTGYNHAILNSNHEILPKYFNSSVKVGLGCFERMTRTAKNSQTSILHANNKVVITEGDAANDAPATQTNIVEEFEVSKDCDVKVDVSYVGRYKVGSTTLLSKQNSERFKAGGLTFDFTQGIFVAEVDSKSTKSVLFKIYAYNGNTTIGYQQAYMTQVGETNVWKVNMSKMNFEGSYPYDFAYGAGAIQFKLVVVVDRETAYCKVSAYVEEDVKLWVRSTNYAVYTKISGIDGNGNSFTTDAIINNEFALSTFADSWFPYILTKDKIDRGDNLPVITNFDGMRKAQVPYELFVADYLPDATYLRGTITQNLMLPDFEVETTVNGQYYHYNKEGYVMLDNARTGNGIEYPSDKQIEKVVVFEDVKPSMNDTIQLLGKETREKEENGEKTGEVETFWIFKTTKIKNITKKDIEDDKIHIVFGTFKKWNASKGEYEVVGLPSGGGKLLGLDFELNLKESDSTGTTFYIIPQDYSGIIPNDYMFPVEGDGYNIYGLDYSFYEDDGEYPNAAASTLIRDAELQVLENAIAYIQKSLKDSNTYTCKMMSDEIYKADAFPKVREQVVLKDESLFGSNGRVSRIVGMEVCLDIPYDTPTLIIGDTSEYSTTGALEDKINALNVSGTNIINYGGYSSGSSSSSSGNSGSSVSYSESISGATIGVITINGNDNKINLTSSAITSALGYTPIKEGSMTLWGNSVSLGGSTNGNIVMNPDDGTYIQIGGIKIVYDEEHEALKVVKGEGEEANLYATGGISAYGFMDSATMSINEVEISESEPIEESVELWVEPNGNSSTVTNLQIDGRGHLIATTNEAEAVIKAKINGVWTDVSGLNTVGTEVSITKCDQYPDGDELAVINVNGIDYKINSPHSLMTKEEILGVLGSGYYNETDPIFTAHAANNITPDMITLLNHLHYDKDGEGNVIRVYSDLDFYSTGGVSAYGYNGNEAPKDVKEVYIGNTEPTDADTIIWVDTTDNKVKAKIGGDWEVVGSGSNDEVYIGTDEPTEEDAELWVNPDDKRQMIIGGYVDETTGHLMLNIPDPEPILQAKIGGEWTAVSQGNGGGGSGTLSAISLRMPSEFLVSPSQLTTNGTFNVSIRSGYHLLTDSERDNLHTHDNKTTIDSLTDNMIDVLRHLSIENEQLKVDVDLYSTGAVSAYGVGDGQTEVSAVVWEQIYGASNGEKIATITIGGETTDVYAPNGGLSNVAWENITGKPTKLSDFTNDLQNVYAAKEHSHSQYLTTEQDPVFTAHAAHSVTDDMIALLGHLHLVKDGDTITKVYTDLDFYSEGGISAYGSEEGSEIQSGDKVEWVQLCTDEDGEKIATITINGEKTDVYAPEGGGATYTQGNYISISGSAISVDLASLKTALEYSKIITTETISQAVSGCTEQDITSALGYTPLKSVAYDDLTTKPTKTQLTTIIDGYYSLSGHDHDNTYLKLSGGTMTNNILMTKGYGIGYKFDDTTRPHSNTQPWYGVAWFEDANDNISGNVHTHIGGYYGICLHTSANRTVRLYNNTEVSEGNSAAGKLQIGDAIITYDDTNKAIKIYSAKDGEVCGLYTTGGITAFK